MRRLQCLPRNRTCAHLKGNGGVKQTVRVVQAQTRKHVWAARFGIASSYGSIDHAVLLRILAAAGADPPLLDAVADYLRLPDAARSGKGMVAGGSIGPLLGALHVLPLDDVMADLERKGRIFYRRFMDDFVILAPTRPRLRAAIRAMHPVLAALGLRPHPAKRFSGRSARGFDFLGCELHPGRKLRPTATSLHRLKERARRLREQGAPAARLRRYVIRWWGRLRDGWTAWFAGKEGSDDSG